MSTAFARRIREVREAKDISQRELARRIGCTGATISQWETGETDPKNIRGALLEKAAGELGKPVSYFLTGKMTSAVADATLAGVGAVDHEVRRIPVIDTVTAGIWTQVSDPHPRGEGLESIGLDADLSAKMLPANLRPDHRRHQHWRRNSWTVTWSSSIHRLSLARVISWWRSSRTKTKRLSRNTAPGEAIRMAARFSIWSR
jgi:transcriptional regulator with XRE-family HTH domain